MPKAAPKAHSIALDSSPPAEIIRLLLIRHHSRDACGLNKLVILSERSEPKDLQFAQRRAEGASLLHFMDRTFYVYLVASRSRTLYIGVTSNIEQRIYEHREKKYPGFSSTYNCNRLILLETYTNPTTAIAREKQLKGWTRAKKITLIQQTNPTWQDLSEGWYPPTS